METLEGQPAGQTRALQLLESADRKRVSYDREARVP